MGKILNNKNILMNCVIILLVIIFIVVQVLFYKEYTKNQNSSTSENVRSSNEVAEIDSTDMFTTRDLEQTADITNATNITVSDNNDERITSEGVYVVSGTANDVTIYVEVEKEEKVQIVLDGVNITNLSKPVIYVASADKVFITTTNSQNTMKVTGTFNYSENSSADAVIFAKDTVVLNGEGTLNIESTANGITSKDKLKGTGGTWVINATNHALEANDAVEICDGTYNLTAKEDGIQCENNDDQTLGCVYISGGTFTIEVGDDGIHAQTIAQIAGGTINITAAEGIEATNVKIDDGQISISASDDGINAAKKSTMYDALIEINGGTLDITMGAGDTDALDANGDLIINGGTINITAQFAFDYDSVGELNGGTVTVNGSQVTTITNSMMEGGKGGMGNNQHMIFDKNK